MSHETLMRSYQDSLYSMLGSFRQLEGHLKNIQARTFEMTEEISYLISDNLSLLDSVNNQILKTSEKEPAAPSTPLPPAALWENTESHSQSDNNGAP
ncbi:hypothetical protein FDENT_9630 [Fusarium denticulatum]|uniref:Uncharacterized protein n=1 Tax=Fusarium denticulatum TaxID=48507 RepID=A0A8H5TUV9_9HYPO|nr:hypothetical protein FDENT_9630 [Fusarium denticulatum]